MPKGLSFEGLSFLSSSRLAQIKSQLLHFMSVASDYLEGCFVLVPQFPASNL